MSFSNFYQEEADIARHGASSFLRSLVGSVILRCGIAILGLSIAGCDGNAKGISKDVSELHAPDNIVVKESFVLARPDIVTEAKNRTIAVLCPELDRVTQQQVTEMYRRTKETYISGRKKTVIEKGFSVGGADDACNSLGRRTERVKISTPEAATNVYQTDGKVSVEISNFTNLEAQNFLEAKSLKSYPSRTQIWKSAKYASREKIFGHECGRQTGSAIDYCTLLPVPLVVFFKDVLVLKAPPHKNALDCDQSVETALANVPFLLLSGRCLDDVIHTIDSFEMNVSIPAEIFELPDSAKGVAPTVKDIK